MGRPRMADPEGGGGEGGVVAEEDAKAEPASSGDVDEGSLDDSASGAGPGPADAGAADNPGAAPAHTTEEGEWNIDADLDIEEIEDVIKASINKDEIMPMVEATEEEETEEEELVDDEEVKVDDGIADENRNQEGPSETKICNTEDELSCREECYESDECGRDANCKKQCRKKCCTVDDAPPSRKPSTYRPTSAPSSAPTPLPTTAAPSSIPTPICHDNQNYRSPINGLGCKHHAGTDCEKWGVLGLSAYEVMRLHRECPVACGTECVPYTLVPSVAPSSGPTITPTNPLIEVSALLEFYLYGASSTMPEDTISTLQQGLLVFFEERLDAQDLTGSSTMTMATVTDQGIIKTSGGGGSRRRQSRMLLKDGPDAAVNLKVKVHATATTRDLDDFMFFALLQGGLSDISSFEDTLTKADDFFVGVDSSTELIAEMNKAETQKESPKISHSTPTITIIISVIGVVALIGLLTGHYVLRDNYSGKFRGTGSAFNLSPRSNGSMFSFEGSPVYRMTPNSPTLRLPHFVRSRNNASDNMTLGDTCSSTEVRAGVRQKGMIHKVVFNSPPVSPENLMAGVPPMIVIDNIDGNEKLPILPIIEERDPSDAGRITSSDKSGLPIRRIEASSSLAKALTYEGRDGNEPITLMNMLHTVRSNEEGEDPKARRQLSPAQNDGHSGLDTIAALSLEGTPTASPRQNMTNSHSRDAIDDIEPSDALDELIRSEWESIGLQGSPIMFSQMRLNKRENSSSPNTSPFRIKDAASSFFKESRGLVSSHISSRTAILSSKLAISTSPRKRQRSKGRGEKKGKSPHQVHNAVASNQVGALPSETQDKVSAPLGSMSGLLSLSMKKFQLVKFKGKSDGSGDGISAKHANCKPMEAPDAKASKSSHALRDVKGLRAPADVGTRSSSAIAVHSYSSNNQESAEMLRASSKPRLIRRSASDSQHLKSYTEDGAYHNFVVSCNSKLGIIIHRNVVHTVKDYSPLFGKIVPGDKIVQIDDVLTKNMTTGEVTRVLTARRNPTGVRNIHLLVWSKMNQTRSSKTGYKGSIGDSGMTGPTLSPTKRVTIDVSAPISHVFVSTDPTNSDIPNGSGYFDQSEQAYDEQRGEHHQHEYYPRHSTHLLGSCPRSDDEDEDDDDSAQHMLMIFSSGDDEDDYGGRDKQLEVLARMEEGGAEGSWE